MLAKFTKHNAKNLRWDAYRRSASIGDRHTEIKSS